MMPNKAVKVGYASFPLLRDIIKQKLEEMSYKIAHEHEMYVMYDEDYNGGRDAISDLDEMVDNLLGLVDLLDDVQEHDINAF